MFNIVCVIYNKSIESVTSLNAFCRLADSQEDVRILLFDNSVDADILSLNRKTKLADYFSYFPNNENVGLSKAYNKALSMIDSDSWIMWTDDDTLFSDEYMNNAYEAARNNKCDIIAGVVTTNLHTTLSPVFMKKDNAKELSCGNTYDHLYCINSGLCVKKTVYELIGKYDETLFLDMIDYWFFDEASRRNINRVYLVPGEIIQSFSGNSKSPIKSQMKRFKIYKKDFKKYCAIEHKPYSYKMKILTKRFFGIIYKSMKK